jgi:hypothetical protein
VIMAARSTLLFQLQLPRFALCRRAAHSAGVPALQRTLAADDTSQIKEGATQWEDDEHDAIVAASLPPAGQLEEAHGVSSADGRPNKPEENQPGIDNHHGVPDKKAKEEAKQGGRTRNNYSEMLPTTK